MGKNSQIHLMIETHIKDGLRKEAAKYDMNLAEFCRTKLVEEFKLKKIEDLILEIRDLVK